MLSEEGIRREGGPGKMIPTHTQIPSFASTSILPRFESITDLTVSIPGLAARPTASTVSSPLPKWRTREFRFYGIAFAVVVPLLIYWPMRLSSSSHPNYHLYAHKLSPGWLSGRQVDNSDAQYRSFRSNVPALMTLSSIQLIISTVQCRLSGNPSTRTRVSAIFSLLMISVLHGSSSLKILLILSLNFHLSSSLKPAMIHRIWPFLLFAGNMVVLFLNEKYDGYRFGDLYAGLRVFDGMRGVSPRWHVGFNITMLRMISFGLDWHWRENEAKAANEIPGGHRARTSTALPREEYNYVNYIAYCLYPPLYVAGPIMTFNDFMWQLRNPIPLETRDKLAYLVRFLSSFLTMEVILHTMYIVAIKDTSAWNGDTPADLSIIGFWNLVVVWLKLLIPWRFFRLWALIDGMDPPENMIRCVANNYSTLGFWRSWHRSYNLWIVRYIYIPVGGSKNQVLATILVFSFVALWHDLSFKLLAWGWLVSLFILPEIIAKKTISSEKFGGTTWYRHLAAIGGVLNLWMMMCANLVGFVLGLEGMKHFLKELTSTWSGLAFLAFACTCLFITVQVMFEYREEERRKGIDRKC